MALSSVFMYGGWFQLIDNMWFLWVLGDNVEDAMSCSSSSDYSINPANWHERAPEESAGDWKSPER